MSKRIELLTWMAEEGCTAPTVVTKLHSDGTETKQHSYMIYDPNGIADEGGEVCAWADADALTQELLIDCLKYQRAAHPTDWNEPHVVTVQDKNRFPEHKRRHLLFGPPTDLGEADEAAG